HIPLPGEKAISGHHCEIYMEGNQFFIRDLQSTNGVYVNNRKVETSVLADGDKIKLGFKIFRFKQS
ncbi:MAG TPA: FHA domain-containing protein, partial [Acidobacteriota bacterium]|nr:FHA domain-containing protein [Acidobacteriota bacterium]